MQEIFSRTEILLGKDSTEKLAASRVIVFGLGGVGGYAVEALARAGIGTIGLVDNDKITLSNINRQIFALSSTVGEFKTDVAERRIKEINPKITVIKYNIFYLPETADEINLTDYDYIVDAVDTMAAKIELAVRAEKFAVPLISSMGTGNKLNPSAFTVSDIYSTSVCPVAKVMRTELKKRGVAKLKVVYSQERPIKSAEGISPAGTSPIGSVPFVPPVAGFILSGEVIKDILKK